MEKISNIKGYEDVMDIYFINKDGRVFSTVKGDYMNFFDNGKGYLVYSLKLKGVRKWRKCYGHRLVAEAFIPNPLNKKEVNHIDENKSNNKLDNLEWITRLDNVNHGTGIKRMIESRCEHVHVFNFKGEYIKEFRSLCDASIFVLGNKSARGRNRRFKYHFILDDKKLTTLITSSLESNYRTIKVIDIEKGTHELFATNQAVRKYLGGKVNVTDSIKENRLVYKKYRISNYDYKELIDSPNFTK